MSSNDVVDLTVEDPPDESDRPIEISEPPPKKRLSAKRQRLEQEFQAYLACLTPADRIQVQNSFATAVQEKQDIINLRKRYQNRSDSEEEEESRPLVVELLDSALVQLDEAVVNIRAGTESVSRCKELAGRARKLTRGVRGRIDGIRQNAALHRLQLATESRDLSSLVTDPAYVESRSGSMVTPQPTTTRGFYQPLANPPTSNQEMLRKAFNDTHYPGLLPDGNMVSTFDRGAYMRAIAGNRIPGARPLGDPRNLELVLGRERASFGQNTGLSHGSQGAEGRYGDESDGEGDESQSLGYQSNKNYEELVDLAMTEAEPLDMPPQMECFPLEHQRQGLGWLVRAERGRNRGGILADDMGLGKTVQTIALLYANQPAPAANEEEEDREEHRLVLIVCPVALIATWQEELKNRVQRQHRLRVYIHHKAMNGPGFLNSPAAIAEEADVVICTYHGIVNEYKQVLNKTRRDRQLRDPMRRGEAEIECGPFPLFELKWHRVVLDEAHLIKNRVSQMSVAVSKLKSKYRLALTGTPMQNRLDELFPLIRFLNIRPYSEYVEFKKLLPPEKSSTTHDFETQKALAAFLSAVMLRRRKDTIISGKKIIDNLPPKHITDISVSMEGEELAQYRALEKGIRDEVNKVSSSENITMSNMLVYLLRMRQSTDHPFLIAITKKASSLRVWGKNKATKEAIDRAMKLDARIRLAALDASPQERVCAECDSDASNISDAYVLGGCGHFLCSECAANAQDDLDSTEDTRQPCPMCMVNYQFIANLEILDVIETHRPNNASTALEFLLAAQRPRVEHLRREEEGRKRRLNELRLGSQFNGLDGFLYDESDSDSGDREADRNDPFNSLTPTPSSSSAGSPTKKEATSLVDDMEADELYEPKDTGSDKLEVGVASLGGKPTDKSSSGSNGQPEPQEHPTNQDSDPLEYKLDIDEIAKLFRVPKIFDTGWTSSAKVEACLDCLRSIWNQAPDDKVIIFSSFTSLLDVLSIPLEAAMVPYALYTGKMNVQERNSTLDEFRRGRCKVLLTSLKAGNVGLTLTQANRVIIVEPFWNPYVEDQAQDRVYRIGQSREVTIYRMRVHDTVEDRIVDLQNNKRALIEGALDNSMKTRAQGLSRTDILYALGLRRKPRSAESILRAYAPVTEPNANTVVTTHTYNN